MMNFVTSEIFRLETVAEIQYLIGRVVIDGCDGSAAALDDLLRDKAPGYRLAALWCAYDLMRRQRLAVA